MSVCAFLGQLFPRSARRNGGELRCMRRGLSLLDSRWKADVDRKRKATFASEDKGMVDAVLMGGFYLPSDSFAMVVEYLDHGTAVRSTPSSKSWWRTISGLPPASHIDTNIGKRLPWGELVTQLKTIKASNPLRAVARVTLGCRTKLGSFHNLGKVVGGVGLTHLDLTRSWGAKKLDFAALAKALPTLRGLAGSKEARGEKRKGYRRVPYNMVSWGLSL
ncbi:hypothetical protein Esi_0081_0080 [Ectocarpus siliculosus]|uniref:Uncharacterized protein n=1 Tax=Ectocarpus siliculosus TaxID=2880 RepID=D8LTA9_ECTSI|nr:hypothetical protein Esi_0081_0080 [Ectocarpus siliculosus]|eukprot:CBN77980.1 hypothetical protein Esi_0081_0080 [Ectocarpus siliculosus]